MSYKKESVGMYKYIDQFVPSITFMKSETLLSFRLKVN